MGLHFVRKGEFEFVCTRDGTFVGVEYSLDLVEKKLRRQQRRCTFSSSLSSRETEVDVGVYRVVSTFSVSSAWDYVDLQRNGEIQQVLKSLLKFKTAPTSFHRALLFWKTFENSLVHLAWTIRSHLRARPTQFCFSVCDVQTNWPHVLLCIKKGYGSFSLTFSPPLFGQWSSLQAERDRDKQTERQRQRECLCFLRFRTNSASSLHLVMKGKVLTTNLSR